MRIPQTGENLSLLGPCHKFPDFWHFPQIPWVFPDWKIGNSFSRFSLISRVAGNHVLTADHFWFWDWVIKGVGLCKPVKQQLVSAWARTPSLTADHFHSPPVVGDWVIKGVSWTPPASVPLEVRRTGNMPRIFLGIYERYVDLTGAHVSVYNRCTHKEVSCEIPWNYKNIL